MRGLRTLLTFVLILNLTATVGQTQQPDPTLVVPIQPKAEPLAPPNATPNPRSITPQELQREFLLVGALGRRANEIMTLDIEIVEGGLHKGESGHVVHVWKINGQTLQQPVRVEYSVWRHAVAVPKMVPKQLYEVRAYEDISYDSGSPIEAYMENNIPVPQAGGSRFRSHLNIIRVIR